MRFVVCADPPSPLNTLVAREHVHLLADLITSAQQKPLSYFICNDSIKPYH